jgi:hypothetical protein
MSSKITIGLDNQTGPGMEQIRRDLAKMGLEGDKAEAAMSQLNAELESRAAKKQAEQIKALADEYEKLNGVVPAAGSKGGMAGNITAVATSVTAAVQVMKTLVEVGKKAYQAIAQLAETSPKFAELKSSLDGVVDSASSAANTFANTDFGAGAINFANARLNSMGEGLKALPTLWQDIRTIAHSTLADIEEGMGVEHSGHRKTISLIQEETAAIEAKAAAAKKAMAVDQSTKAAAAATEAIAKATAAAESQRAIAAMTDRNDVLRAINAETEAIKSRAAAGEDPTGEKAMASAQKIMALKAQERKIQDDEVARLKAGDDAALKHHEETEKQILDAKQKAIDEETAMLEKAEDERWTDAMKRIELRQAAEAKAAEERVVLAQQEAKAKAEAQTKMADNLKGNAGAIFAGLDPRKVAQQVGKQREKAAFDQFGREHNREYLDAKNDGDTGAMRRLERQQKEAAAKARQQGFRDVKRGNASGDEMIQAQTGLANEVIGNAEATGKVNKAQADALREAANTMSQQQQQLNRLEQDIRATGAQINGLQGRGSNSTARAQMTGGGR